MPLSPLPSPPPLERRNAVGHSYPTFFAPHDSDPLALMAAPTQVDEPETLPEDSPASTYPIGPSESNCSL